MGLNKSANIGMPDVITILEFGGRERKDRVPPTLPQLKWGIKRLLDQILTELGVGVLCFCTTFLRSRGVLDP